MLALEEETEKCSIQSLRVRAGTVKLFGQAEGSVSATRQSQGERLSECFLTTPFGFGDHLVSEEAFKQGKERMYRVCN